MRTWLVDGACARCPRSRARSPSARAGRATAAMPAARATRARAPSRATTSARLRHAWEYRTGDVSDGKGNVSATSFQATPILFEDTLYLCSPFNRVIALDPRTGAARWTFDPKVEIRKDNQTRKTDGGALRCRGVAAWADPGAPRNCAVLAPHLRRRHRRPPHRARCTHRRGVHGLRQRRQRSTSTRSPISAWGRSA